LFVRGPTPRGIINRFSMGENRSRAKGVVSNQNWGEEVGSEVVEKRKTDLTKFGGDKR